jgi:2-polyprenyl-3-methyl-5-hydroxy-6-metoxy-1,4-benzoquinol methylase
MNKDLVAYYKERAKEYEKIYEKPERQEEIIRATKILQEIFFDKEILEIACGTGYWTERIAKTAKSILATDINDAVIDIARKKIFAKASVNFRIEDIFNFTHEDKHDNLFAGFIWSHIRLEELDNFLSVIHRCVNPGGTVVFMDNNFVADSSNPITETDKQNNTYQERRLENGSLHLVLKNFPTEDFIKQKLNDKASDITFYNLKYYWIVQYKSICKE